MRHGVQYEADDEHFDAEAYAVDGYRGIAWYVLGWELAPLSTWMCQDCDAAGYERPQGGGATTSKGDPDCEHLSIAWDQDTERTGRVVAVMVGDDRRFVVDEEDVTPLAREDYCGECGQVGCTHDGYDRTA